MCVYFVCVHWALSLERHQRTTNFDPGGICRDPYVHLRSPLPASKSVLSSWSLVVMCPVIARERSQPALESKAGISSYHALYMDEYIYGM